MWMIFSAVVVIGVAGIALLVQRARERRHRATRAEAAASRARLHASLSSAGVAVLAVDRAGLVSWEEGGLTGLDSAHASLLGRSAWDAFHDLPELAAALRAGLRGGRGVERVHVGDSSFDVNYAPRFDEAGRVIEVVAVIRDVSQEQIESDRAERLADVRSRTVRVMGYRLRGQLASVLGATELARGGGTAADWLAEVERASARLLSYVEHLVDFLELDAGRMQPHPTTFSLRDVLDRLDARHRGRALADGTVFVVRAPRTPMDFEGDVRRIEQTLDLMLSVALATNQGGQVVLNVDIYPRHPGVVGLVVSVEDSGRGLTSEAQARVFDGFDSASAFWATRSGNSGLELPLARRLASLLDGTLEVESEVDRGTALRLRLDLPRTWMVHRPTSDVPHEVAAGRVLLVDDDAQQRRVHRALAEASGWTVIEARNGAEALTTLERLATPPHDLELDAVLTELHMPVLDGVGLARAIAERWPALPVGVLSADAQAETAHSDETAVVAWGVKPIGGERLARMLTTLGTRRLGPPLEHAGSPLDEGALERLRLLDPVEGPVLAQQLAAAFVAAAPLQLLQLTSALAGPDVAEDALDETVASLALSARLLGLPRLAEALATLEAERASGRTWRAIIPSVASEVQAAREALLREVLVDPSDPVEVAA